MNVAPPDSEEALLTCLSEARELLRYAVNNGNTPVFLTKSRKFFDKLAAIEEGTCIDSSQSQS